MTGVQTCALPIYFIITDMMAKAATGTMSAEDSVKWAAQQCEDIFQKWSQKS